MGGKRLRKEGCRSRSKHILWLQELGDDVKE